MGRVAGGYLAAAMAVTGTTRRAGAIDAGITVGSLDHVVLTVQDADAAIAFYRDVLGMRLQTSSDGRRALHFGEQKLNLHEPGVAPDVVAAHPAPGSADLCFVTSTPVEGVLRVLGEHGVEVLQGPVERAGATGQLLSVYVRDPDGNLVELANRLGT